MQSTQPNLDTVFESLDGTNELTVNMQPAINTPNTVGVRLNITEHSYVINNKPIIAGNLGMLLKNHKTDIDFTIEDKQGSLIVSGDDAAQYSIDENGHLIYTYK